MAVVCRIAHPKLATLDVSFNAIEDLKGLDKLASLQVCAAMRCFKFYCQRTIASIRASRFYDLYVLDCAVTPPVPHHRAQQVIEVRKNRLISLDGIRSAPSLRCVYAAQNRIKDIGSLKGLSSLERVHLRGNKITVHAGLSLTFLRIPYHMCCTHRIWHHLWRQRTSSPISTTSTCVITGLRVSSRYRAMLGVEYSVRTTPTERIVCGVWL
jgi:hypothetical protein